MEPLMQIGINDIRARLLACVSFLICSVSHLAVCQVPDPAFQKIHDEWKAIDSAPPPKDFLPVIHDLKAFRNSSGGKSWQTDYMLGVAYCRTPGNNNQKAGNQFLDRVRRSLLAPESARSAADQVMKWCVSSSDGPEDSPTFQLTSVAGLNQGGVLNKGGYEMPHGDSTEFNTSQESEPDILIWDNRLFPPSKSAEAVAAAKERTLGFYFQGGAASGFVIETEVGRPADVGICMAKYRSALQTEFGMVAPANLITVYALVSDVPRLADHLHLLKMPLGTVAYSVPLDLSIVGIGTGEHCGTLAHELTHLFIRQNFGDSPAWLEEGLASEVAVSIPTAAGFQFIPSWRDVVLKRDWQMRPTVPELLNLTWANFTTNDPKEVEHVAAIHAMAASFVRYLDAKKKLVPLYKALRDGLSSDTPQSDVEVFTSVLGKSPDQVDNDFSAWFVQNATPVHTPF
ncbi:hypothetical protein [Granulicella rosea]|nr:hypothetical protein [Granulicella rosea]